ncbi:heme-binding domain-containing protein [Robiginitalea sp. M366]|uniref:heme-binding domain-containing protein n=1 Tax=Robiginitalea aestuariiviva TaxID=3036903 RepID=UPI00240D53A6|nr:heme-binding domain-containing protein [Robiginitalea aestuariiviva]MDG1573501.1 heme-binding domain-containing protein [Robiginitalea aestuariiviva]
MKIGKKIAWALLLAFIVIQFIRPEKNESTSDHLQAFLQETTPPEGVSQTLSKACYDCHSDHTEYPWYNHIAPVSFWLASHVDEGKEHLNFSEWAAYSAKKKDHKLEEVVETVEEGEMPLREYTWTHAGARLTAEEKEALIAWAKKSRTLYPTAAAQE